MFKSLVSKDKDMEINYAKEDTFCLGLVLLEAGLKSNLQDIYDEDEEKLDEEKLSKYLNEFKDKYPQNKVLQKSLEMMLEDEDQRPDLMTLKDNL